MATQTGVDALQQILLEMVFGLELTPQSATARAIRTHPETELLTWVYVLTLIATNLRNRFTEQDNWSYADWLEAAASLGCDIYALDALGKAKPTGHDLAELWAEKDPHLT